MRIILTIFIVISSLNYALANDSLRNAFPQGTFNDMSPAGRTSVSQIISPDTIALTDGRIIHLVGLNFPDLYTPNSERELAKTAKRVLTDMLLGNDVRLYKPKGKNAETKNRMDHDIAHIVRASDEAWIQGTLIMLGLARVETNPAQTDLVKQMIKLEKTARREKRGLWSLDHYNVLNADTIPDDAVNNFAIITGNVQNIASVRNKTYINFGKDYRTDFTLVLDPKDKKRFNKVGLNPQDWGGKRMRVRGWLEEYNGPMMTIDHPEQIEFLR